jgi:hypothetical protein
VTPLVELGSQQVDYVKAARRLGIRSVLCVASWDNLTSKGLMRVVPDHVVVWNDAQKPRPWTLHGARPEQVQVTGAQPFDRWFEARPSREREAFCRAGGPRSFAPFLLYVGSSSFIAPDEVPFVERWLSRVARSSDARIARIGVLIRPIRPTRGNGGDSTPRRFPNVAAVAADRHGPERAGLPSRLLRLAVAQHGVVGINTSAQIEAAIVGRPVLTIRAPEFAHSQEGTLHFRHLVDQGPVSVADSFDAHLSQLAECLDGMPAAAGGAPRGRSCERFVRPMGLSTPAAPSSCERITRLAASRGRCRRPIPGGRRSGGCRLALIARVAYALAEDRPLWVHALRPVLAGSAWTLALVDGPGDGWAALARARAPRPPRRLDVWYESTRACRGYGRRGRKALRRWTRPVEAVVRRPRAARDEGALLRAARHLLPQLRGGGAEPGRSRPSRPPGGGTRRCRGRRRAGGTVGRGHPTVTHGAAPPRERNESTVLSGKLRLAMDVLRYLAPEYDGAIRLRERAAARAPFFAARWTAGSLVRIGPVRRLLAAALRRAERAIPGSATIEAYLRDQRPDLLVVTPLIGVVGSPQPDYIRAAKVLGVPTALAVWSWDHLTSKALIRDTPDRVFVWNEIQKTRRSGCTACRRRPWSSPARSASTSGSIAHRAARARCSVARWVSGRPPVRALRRLGALRRQSLRGGVRAAVDRDVAAESGPAVRSAGILVRPHPQRMHEWDGLETVEPGRRRRVGAAIRSRTRRAPTTSTRWRTAPQSSA